MYTLSNNTCLCVEYLFTFSLQQNKKFKTDLYWNLILIYFYVFILYKLFISSGVPFFHSLISIIFIYLVYMKIFIFFTFNPLSTNVLLLQDVLNPQHSILKLIFILFLSLAADFWASICICLNLHLMGICPVMVPKYIIHVY